jgi:hypothetical protein
VIEEQDCLVNVGARVDNFHAALNAMSSALARTIRRLLPVHRRVVTHSAEPHESSEIQFYPLDPAASSAGGATTLLCPVTRQELKPGMLLLQCRACRTSYSEEGWRFLKAVDRGRCCTCGQRKTVTPLS